MSKQTSWQVLLAAFLLAATLPQQAQSTNITVDGTDCSLTAAINSAYHDIAVGGCLAGSGEDDIITLKSDVVVSDPIYILDLIVIEGNGHTIRRAGDGGIVFHITSGCGYWVDEFESSWYGCAELTLNDVTIYSGLTNNSGAIYSLGGSLTLNNSTISGSNASDSNEESRASENDRLEIIAEIYGSTPLGGGAICNMYGTVILNNSTVSGNSTGKNGGGICNQYGTVILNNSTVSGNSAGATYGAGGGIFTYYGTIKLNSSIVSGNTAAEGNEVADASLLSNNKSVITADSFNLFGHSGETSLQAFASRFTPGAGDMTATSDGIRPTVLSAILGPLADNGGPTLTHALPAGSPAIDLDATCSTGLTEDQRGYTRPVNLKCDAGAFEYGAAPDGKKANIIPVYKMLLLRGHSKKVGNKK